MTKKVEIERQQLVFDDFFQIEEAYLRHEQFDGQMSRTVRQLVFKRGDSVAALIFNRQTNRIILIDQFRYPTYHKGPGWMIETIAGMVEADETPETAIRREVLEEVGYQVHKLTHISTFYVSPGGTSERIILYYGEVESDDQVTIGGGVASEHEDIRRVEFSLTDLWQAFEAGRIVDAKTIIGLLWLQNRA